MLGYLICLFRNSKTERMHKYYFIECIQLAMPNNLFVKQVKIFNTAH